MKLSQQQQAVLDWAVTGTGSLNLIARAGCGKTTTAVELTKTLKGDVLLCAFNVKIVEEMAAKLEANGVTVKHWDKTQGRYVGNVECSTVHSLGFQAWRYLHKGVRVEKNKLHLTVQELKVPEEMEDMTARLVTLAKQRAFGVLERLEDEQAWFRMIEHFNLDAEVTEQVDWREYIRWAVLVYRETMRTANVWVDYDDMIVAPLWHKCRFFRKDWILIDEAQDTNPARRALLLAYLKPRGRMVAIGDPQQAIYGFAGADSDSMDIIQRSLNATVLPLNVTRRCPKTVVAEAQEIVPDFQAHPDAPEGTVRTTEDVTLKSERLTPKDAVLCRKTAPLITLAYSLIRQGVACHVEGRKIGEGLVKLVNHWKVTNINALVPRLAEWREREIGRALAKNNAETAQNIEDKVETVLTFIDVCRQNNETTVEQLRRRIVTVFQDQEDLRHGSVTLSTVHRAKGREWDRVFLFGRNRYMPSRYARTDWQMQQEMNLIYVAITRAKQELVMVHVTKEPTKQEVAA